MTSGWIQVTSDVQKHDEVIFDLRSPASSTGQRDGNVRAVRFYIGDGPSDEAFGSVRTIVEEMPTSSDMCSILIDSGSKSSVGLSGIYWCSFRFVVRLAKRFF